MNKYKITYLKSGLECADYYFAKSPQNAIAGMISESNLKYWWPTSREQILRVEAAP